MQVPLTGPTDVGAWARTIVDVYILWFTFLVSSNILAMAWTHARTIAEDVRPLPSPISGPMCWLLVVINVLTVCSTILVATTVRPYAPPGHDTLITWAAIANSIVVLGCAFVWFFYWSKLNAAATRHAAGF